MTEEQARDEITAKVNEHIRQEGGIPNIPMAREYMQQLAEDMVARMPAPWSHFRVMVEFHKRKGGMGIKFHLPRGVKT